MTWRAIDTAAQYLGLSEVPGMVDNPAVLAMLQRKNPWAKHDEVPWCAAFVDHCLWVTGHETTGSLRARSFIECGKRIWTAGDSDTARLDLPKVGDIAVITRGGGKQPGPDVIEAQGHVGFFVAMQRDRVVILGGNQGNKVSIRKYARSRLLTVSRPKRITKRFTYDPMT